MIDYGMKNMERIILIIGKRSNLSKKIFQKLDNVVLISSSDVLENIDLFDTYKNFGIVLIFNNFQPSYELNNTENPLTYISHSVLLTSMVLSKIKNNFTVDKIIYTSSSSVYGNNNFCDENDVLMPLSLHASLKISNEKLVENYCITYNINYTITRVFNMYGGEDKFSIVSKIIASINNKEELTLLNQGSAIRDYIHIDDVVNAYLKLIDMREVFYINIASGLGTSVKNIIDYLRINKVNVKIKNISKKEIKISTSSVDKLNQIMDIGKFIHVEKFILKQLKL